MMLVVVLVSYYWSLIEVNKGRNKFDLIRQMEDISKVDLIKNKVYTMRTYMDNLIVHDYNSAAGCTGSGNSDSHHYIISSR